MEYGQKCPERYRYSIYILHIVNILPVSMQELAPIPIGTIHSIVELLAEPRPIIRGEMRLLLELLVPMRKGAVLPKLTLPILTPILTQLSLDLRLIGAHKPHPVLLAPELPFRPLVLQFGVHLLGGQMHLGGAQVEGGVVRRSPVLTVALGDLGVVVVVGVVVC